MGAIKTQRVVMNIFGGCYFVYTILRDFDSSLDNKCFHDERSQVNSSSFKTGDWRALEYKQNYQLLPIVQFGAQRGKQRAKIFSVVPSSPRFFLNLLTRCFSRCAPTNCTLERGYGVISELHTCVYAGYRPAHAARILELFPNEGEERLLKGVPGSKTL